MVSRPLLVEATYGEYVPGSWGPGEDPVDARGVISSAFEQMAARHYEGEWRFYMSPRTVLAVVQYLREMQDALAPGLTVMNLRLYGYEVVQAPQVPDGCVYFVEG